MTVVVYDGSTVAVDSGGSQDGTVHRIKKWYLSENEHVLIVRVGNSMVSGAMLEWWKGERSEFPNGAKLADGLAELIVFHAEGTVLRYATSEQPDVIRKSCAFGSGKDFAYGALHWGANAKMAVEAACYYSVHCHTPIDTFLSREGKWVHEETKP